MARNQKGANKSTVHVCTVCMCFVFGTEVVEGSHTHTLTGRVVSSASVLHDFILAPLALCFFRPVLMNLSFFLSSFQSLDVDVCI